MGPSKAAEKVVGMLIPPACREEVLGDLCERFESPARYVFDACRTVPFVILSRVRRTSDPQIVLIQAFALYLSFLGAAWMLDGALLRGEWGLVRLAIAPALAIAGIMLEDAYRRPGLRSTYGLARGPLIGLGLAWLTQAGEFAVPLSVMLAGCGVALLMSTAIRMLFPPMADQLEGANAPARWLERAGADSIFSPGAIRLLQAIAAVAAIAVVGMLVGERTSLPAPRVMAILALLLGAYLISRRI